MTKTGNILKVAFRALSRNKLQTALTTIGMTIGVATVLTMIALGTGAESAIEQQVRAAGIRSGTGDPPGSGHDILVRKVALLPVEPRADRQHRIGVLPQRVALGERRREWMRRRNDATRQR